MSLKLYENLPEALEIDGQIYPINPDFRIMIKFSMGVQDKILSSEYVLAEALAMFYPEKMPPDKKIQGFYEFYEGGTVKNVTHSNGERTFDFDHDASYLIAAFQQQYDMDLISVEKLHWWKFKALFRALTEETKLIKIIGYRSVDLNKMSKETREFYANMKIEYALPQAKGDAIASEQLFKQLMGGDLNG